MPKRARFFIDYMKHPQQYIEKGFHPPKGVLLHGVPGTGKTMLAKAMATEADMTFMSAEGSQFLKKYVGEGPEAIHALFRTARKYAPTILFIDEIDAIGKNRQSAGDSNSRADILNALLTEMSGFKTTGESRVFVLARRILMWRAKTDFHWIPHCFDVLTEKFWWTCQTGRNVCGS